MKAIIPAAGYAKRMWPLTSDKPKHFLEVGGRPVLDYVVDKVNDLEVVDEILVVTNDLFYPVFEKWVGSYTGRCSVKILNDRTKSEEDKLGAIGDLNYVLDREGINGDFVVVLGDNLFNFDLTRIHEEFVKRKGPVIGLYDVGEVEIAKRMNSIKLDSDGRIVYFKEKDQEVVDTNISVGIYFYSGECVGLVRRYLEEGNSPDRPGDFVGWLHKEVDVYSFSYSGEGDKWYDVGDMEIYEEVQRVWGKV